VGFRVNFLKFIIGRMGAGFEKVLADDIEGRVADVFSRMA
jgi:hypothetical protein